MLDINDLHDYQKSTVNAIVLNEKLALWLDMGLGKTIITLTAIDWLLKKQKIDKVLIIAPKTVCENVWSQEAKQWNHVKDLKISLVTGTEKERIDALKADADIYVISRDNVAWLFLQDYFKADMLVIDESSSFKDRSTKRWAALMQKSLNIGGKKHFRKTKMIDMFNRVLLLSGTPASESYAGLWAQIALLKPTDNPLEKTISAFREKYMIPQILKGYPVYIKMRDGAVDEINNKLVGLCISMKSEDYLQLPDRIDIKSYFANNDTYKEMSVNGFICPDNVDIIAGDTFTLYTKLQQLSSGFIYDDKNEVHIINNNKLNVLKELLESTNENVLIMYHFQYEKEQLKKIGGVALEDEKSIKKWQDGKIKIGLLYPASGGYGLNLASGGSIIIWYTLPLSLEQYLQANKRIHRQGQKKVVRIIHLLMRDSLDEYIYKLLQAKQDVLNGLMEYFKKVF